MSEERLILKPQPPRHRQRFFLLVGLGVLVILVVWGLQIKLTFARYATSRAEKSELTDAAERINEARKIDPQIQTDGVAAMEQLVRDMLAKQEAQDQKANPVMTEPTTEVTTDTQIENPAASN